MLGSVKTSLMTLCISLVLAVSIVIGAVAIISIKTTTTLAMTNYSSAMNEGYNSEIKSQVQSVITVLQTEYDKYKAGELTLAEAKAGACEIVRNMRYGDDASGYFWIDDTNYILVMHPVLPEQEGNNRKNLEDQNGVMIVQEILKVANTAEGGGYNEFYFTKSDGDLTTLIEVKDKSELRRTADALNTAQAHSTNEASGSVVEIAEGIDNINTQRERMTENIDVLNQLATDNAASTEETSAMTKELDGAVRDSAKLIEEVLSHTNTLVTNASRFKV